MKIEDAINLKPSVLKSLLHGDIGRAMNSINTKPPAKPAKEPPAEKKAANKDENKGPE